MKITFINEMADLCEQVGADVQDVARGIGMDGRIGSKFLHAGPGYGVRASEGHAGADQDGARCRQSVRLIETTVSINDQRKRAMARKVAAMFGSDGVRGKTIALLGLTFKPNTDDMRDAPSLSIIRALQDQGAILRGFRSGRHRPGAARDRGCVHLLRQRLRCRGRGRRRSSWSPNGTSSVRSLDFARLKAAMNDAVLVDLRNVYDPPPQSVTVSAMWGSDAPGLADRADRLAARTGLEEFEIGPKRRRSSKSAPTASRGHHDDPLPQDGIVAQPGYRGLCP